MLKLTALTIGAIKRCRIYVLSILMTYCLSVSIGIIMVHNGNNFALSYRDKIVGHALQTDKASISYQKGNNLSAAFTDFCENLFFAALPQTIMGIGIVIPYFSVAIQGWIGGIVSVDGEHKSRLTHFKSACYYLLTLLLQFIPFSLAIGAGIKFGIDLFKTNKRIGWLFWKYKIDKKSLTDLGYVYILAVPLLFLASCFEFMSGWNT